MENKEHYIYLTSTDSHHFYPDNKANCFYVKLGERLRLSGSWKVALKEIYCPPVPPTTKFINVLCPIIAPSIVGDLNCHLLRKIKTEYRSKKEKNVVSKAFPKSYYIPITNVVDIETLYIKVTDQDFNLVNFDIAGETHMVLHFKKV